MNDTFPVGRHVYRSDRLNAFEQFDVARMLRNVLASLAMVEEEMKKKPMKTPASPRAFVQLMCTLAGGLTKSESDASIALCLAKVERQEKMGWSRVREPISGGLMFEDIQMPQMVEIVWHVLRINGLIDFFAVSPSSSETTEPAATRDGHDSRVEETGSSVPRSRASAGTSR